MKFDWHPHKSAKNANERGLPFEIAMALFDGDTVEFDDRRQDYGERRIIVYGAISGRVMVCVYTWRGTAAEPIRWIISLRKAKQSKERSMPIGARSRSDLNLAKIDWTRFDATTDEEIDRQIADDPDTAPVFSAEEFAAAGRRIERDDVVDVRILREHLGLSQAGFAKRYGFSVETIRQYEQGKRTPSGPARTLLQVIATEPDAVTRALTSRR